MALWALLSPGVLVRTGHTVLTWGITLVLFLHDTGEPDKARSQAHPISPPAWVSRGPLILRHIEIHPISASSSVFLICVVQRPSALCLIAKLVPN